MKIKIIKFNTKLKFPKRAYYNDAGADVFSDNNYIIKASTTCVVDLGFGLNLPDGIMACIYPKSSLTSNGIIAHLPPIDSGYKGEIHAIITNTTGTDYIINKGDKVGQLVILPIILADFVDELGEERNDGAFGSTGIK